MWLTWNDKLNEKFTPITLNEIQIELIQKTTDLKWCHLFYLLIKEVVKLPIQDKIIVLYFVTQFY